MAQHDENVRNHSPVVQGKKHTLMRIKGPLANALSNEGEYDMPALAIHGNKSTSVDDYGRLLVFAAPLVVGFRGAPLALSAANSIRRDKNTPRKNWAKRRAFVA
jgi:hypothetical protein